MDLITSRSNSKVRRARSLRDRRARQETCSFLVEGIRHVGEAVDANARIEDIFYTPERLKSEYAYKLIQEQSQLGVPCSPTTASVFDSLTERQNPQGILAVVRQPDHSLEDLTPENFSWGVALVRPQDPGNLGAIMRTIDAVGADGLLLLDGGVDPYHPGAVRASMGAIFWHKVLSLGFEEFERWVQGHAYHVYGSSAHAELDYRAQDSYSAPAILLLGSEREGLSPEQAALCERLIRLPMHGKTTSLNLGVAAGVLLYDMREKFGG